MFNCLALPPRGQCRQTRQMECLLLLDLVGKRLALERLEVSFSPSFKPLNH